MIQPARDGVDAIAVGRARPAGCEQRDDQEQAKASYPHR
jgi:hypothetical protein